MKQFVLFISIFALSAMSSLAQTTAVPRCPTIMVYGPSGVVNPGDFADFKALIKDDAPQNIAYVWTAHGGEVSQGQGTSSIKVQVPLKPSFVITAMVEIVGLPEGCNRTASETFAEDAPPANVRLGDIADHNYHIEKNLITKIEKNLREQPHAQLFIVLEFAKDATKTTIGRAKSLLSRQLGRTIESVLIVFVTVANGGHGGAIWLVPPGAIRPTP